MEKKHQKGKRATEKRTPNIKHRDVRTGTGQYRREKERREEIEKGGPGRFN